MYKQSIKNSKSRKKSPIVGHQSPLTISTASKSSKSQHYKHSRINHKSTKKLPNRRDDSRFFSASSTLHPNVRVQMALLGQELLTQQHQRVMDVVSSVKFPSKAWDDKWQGDTFSPTRSDDTYALLAQHTTFQHAQVNVPNSLDSHIYLSNTLPGTLSSPISIEQVHKTVSFPLHLSQIFHHKNTTQNTPNESNNDDKITFNVSWQTQSTQVDMGLDEFSMYFAITVPHSFHQHFLSTISTQHAHNIPLSFTTDDLNSLIATPKSLSSYLDTPATAISRIDPQVILKSCHDTKSKNTHTYAIINHYGESLRHDDRSFNHHEFMPLFLHAWKTMPGSGLDQGGNLDLKAATKSVNSYDLLWYTSYAASHPSNLLWDRLMVEVFGIQGTKDQFKEICDKFIA